MADNNMPAISPSEVVNWMEKFKELGADNFKIAMSELMALQMRVAEADFNNSMAAARAEITKPEKDKINPLYNSRYSSITAVLDACIPALTRHGILARFTTEATGDPRILRMILILSKGIYSERATLDVGVSVEGPRGGRPAMNAAQALGSGMTYARKYMMQNACNLAPDEETDDDGNAAGVHGQQAAPGNGAQQPYQEETKPAASMSEKELLAGFAYRLAFPPDQDKAKSLAGWRGEFTAAQRKLVDRLLKEIRAAIAADNAPHREMDQEAQNAADRDRADGDPGYDPDTGEVRE